MNMTVDVQNKVPQAEPPDPDLTITCSCEGELSQLVARDLESLQEAIREDQTIDPEMYEIEYTTGNNTFKIRNNANFKAFAKKPNNDGEYKIVLLRKMTNTQVEQKKAEKPPAVKTEMKQAVAEEKKVAAPAIVKKETPTRVEKQMDSTLP